jgi:excisionase family DNA binding protein
MTDDDEKFELDSVLTAKEAGRLLKLTAQTVISLCANGKIPGAKIGGSWRFLRAELEGLLTAQAVQVPRRKTGRPTSEEIDALIKRTTRGWLENHPKRMKPLPRPRSKRL